MSRFLFANQTVVRQRFVNCKRQSVIKRSGEDGTAQTHNSAAARDRLSNSTACVFLHAAARWIRSLAACAFASLPELDGAKILVASF